MNSRCVGRSKVIKVNEPTGSLRKNLEEVVWDEKEETFICI